MATDVVARMPGAALTAGRDRRWVTREGAKTIRGVLAVAQPDGRYELQLHLIVAWPPEPLEHLGDEVRRRIRAAAKRAGREDQLGDIKIHIRRRRGPRRSRSPRSDGVMLFLARSLTRLVGSLLIVALALVGAAAAVFCIQGGHGTLSLAGLASDLHLAALRHTVGIYLLRLRSPGPVAFVSAFAGAGAVLLGLVLLVGALVPRRERLVVLAGGEQGQIAARRRALAQAAALLAEQPRGVLGAKARARPWRRKPGGRLRVRVRTDHAQGSSDGELIQAVTGALAPLTGPLPVHARVRAKRSRRTARVS